jgi:hypothetical protein
MYVAMNRFRVITSSVAAALGVWCGQSAAQNSDAGPPLILNAAPQNEAVFLTWSVLPAASYSILWRPKGLGDWRPEHETTQNFLLVSGLTNGKIYEFELEANDGNATYRSDPIQIEPRRRSDCNEPTHRIYCTQDSFLQAVAERTNTASPLLCGGVVVPTEGVMPDCVS